MSETRINTTRSVETQQPKYDDKKPQTRVQKFVNQTQENVSGALKK